MRRFRTVPAILLAVLVAGAASPARAQSALGGPVLLAFKVGAAFGQPVGPFGTAFVPELEVGYGFGPGHPFVVAVSARYTAPMATGTTPRDPRLPGDGTLRYTVTENELALALTATWRFDTGRAWRPYVALGPRLYLTRTDVGATAGGQDLGANAETSTAVGVCAAAGTEWAVGPGALLGEVQLAYAPVADQLVLQGTALGGVDVVVGYRLFF